MTYQQILDYYGTPAEAADKLGVSRPTLSAWKRRGFIPIGRQALIHMQTRGRLKCDRPELVPQ